jgi:Fe-S-cluster containining protein
VERVYFTWPDRRLRYECRGCGACCKGHGIGLDVAGGQLVQLVARRPEIVPFLRRRGEAITAFNPRDRCWFLDDGGLCRIWSARWCSSPGWCHPSSMASSGAGS